MSDILVVGSLNADLVIRAPRFPQPGETISGEDLQVIPGGKGANQAVAAARQGAQTALVGRVGGDQFAPFLVQNLQANRVDVSQVRADSSASGVAIIIVDESGQNSIVLSPGANAKVAPQDVDLAAFPDAQILLLQLEIPTPTVLRAAQEAHRRGRTVILNPAPAQALPAELLANTDILIPNESELELLSGESVQNFSSVESAAKKIMTQGVKVVVVTLGERGAALITSDKTEIIPAFKVNAVDTTAAGDAFIGGFAASLLKGESLATAVRYGSACGALAVSKFGAQPSLPTKEETERFLEQRS
ncbi:MAG: ribokinase [Anaerolineales bacterium]|nr:ribokinase [Anaerolineales bacterium]